MVDKMGLVKDGKFREFNLGRSFDNSGSFHSFRYDFKPASVDTTKMAHVEMGAGHSATVTVPHSQGSGSTVYKGNNRPLQKECVLIIDHSTGDITLEKLSSTVQLKKTRVEGSTKAAIAKAVRPSTPVDKPKPAAPPPAATPPPQAPSSKNPSTPVAAATAAPPAKKARQAPPPNPMKKEPISKATISSSDSSSSSSDSDSDDDDKGSSQKTAVPKPAVAADAVSLGSVSTGSSSAGAAWAGAGAASLLCDDLQLSESGSDSD